MAVSTTITTQDTHMTEFKNLKVPKETHERLVSKADRMGMKVYTLADALLQAGLKMNATALQQAIAEAQQEVTPPEGSTTREP